MKKPLLLITLTILFFALYKFVGSPITEAFKFSGKETVDSVIAKLQSDVWDRLEYNLGIAGYKMDFPNQIVLVAFKEEQILKVYAKDSRGIQLIKDYPFTASSGALGPKLKEGDRQIPEGIYEMGYLNPNSAYHLSIKVNYPNEFDKSKTKFTNTNKMGGDIFIHGKAVTIGCIPIGDLAIEEVFVLARKARSNKTTIIISPRDFRTNSNYPKIDGINWENELYKNIHHELKKLPSNE